MTELLDAVDDLTLPIRVTVTLDDGRSHTVEHPSLLTQLCDAIGGSVGTGSSTSAKHERSMVDADALYRFSLISSQVGDWCRIVEIPSTRNPSVDLRRWYVAYSAGPGEAAEFCLQQLRDWKQQITDQLEPARTQDLPQPCPECTATTWWNPSTGSEYQRPLVVRYRLDAGENEFIARCRACGTTWSARELAWELEGDVGKLNIET